MGTTTTNAPAANEAKETKELGIRAKFRAEPVILVATENPKKKGTQSHTRFDGYFKIDWSKDQSVGSVLDAGIVRMDDIRNDNDKGYIVVGKDAIKAHEKAMETKRKDDIEAARKLLAEVDSK